MASASRLPVRAEGLRSAPSAAISLTRDIALICVDFDEQGPARVADALAAAVKAGAEPRFAHVRRRLAVTSLTFAADAPPADAAAAAVAAATGGVVSAAAGFAVVTLAAEGMDVAAALESRVYEALASADAQLEAISTSESSWSALAPAEAALVIFGALETALRPQICDDECEIATAAEPQACPPLNPLLHLGDRRQGRPENDPAHCA